MYTNDHCVNKICPVSLGLSGAIVCIAFVFFFGILGQNGYFPVAVAEIQRMYPDFPLTFAAIATVAFWGGLKSFIYLFLLAFLYDFIVCKISHHKCCVKEGNGKCCNKDKTVVEDKTFEDRK